MMKKLILMLAILFQVIGFQTQAQHAKLKNSKETLIGPANVNVHYEEQIEYYVHKYESFIVAVDEFSVSQNEKELEKISATKRLKRRNEAKIRELEKLLSGLEKDKKSAKEYAKLWSDYKMTEGKDLSEVLSENTCYEITGENGTYAPNEYKILEINANEKLQWDEFVKVKSTRTETVTKQVVIEPASSVKRQRKKRDCKSANPEDCLEWIEVGIPAKYGTVTEKENIRACPRGFKNKDIYDGCAKNLTLDSEKKYIKIIDIATGMEIKVVSYEEVKCE